MKKYLKSHLFKLLAVVVFIALGTVISIARANPVYLPQHTACSTATATSAPALIATSTATSTLSCDAYALTTSITDPTAIANATLAIQFHAPSVATILTVAVQYSEDNVDWYDDDLGAVGTTTGPTNVAPAKTFVWTAGTTATSSKIISIATPTRYVRALFSQSAGSATSTVWATFIPRKERAE